MRGGMAPTYFPGTGTVAEAQRVRLGTSEETSIAFSLQTVRTSRIAGTVVSAAGGPPANGAVALSAGGDDVFFGGGAWEPILADGVFNIPNVSPGSYVLTARTGGARGPGGRNGGEMEMGTVSVTVNGEDVTGVTITMTRGARLEGTIVGAGGSRPPLEGLRVVSRPVRAFGAVPGARRPKTRP
jgi:hypothetical protein